MYVLTNNESTSSDSWYTIQAGWAMKLNPVLIYIIGAIEEPLYIGIIRMTDINSCTSIGEGVTIKPHLKDRTINSTHPVKRGHTVEHYLHVCTHTESLGV